MRLIAVMLALTVGSSALAEEKSANELEKLQARATEARQAAAANPTIENLESPPVVAYLIEQQRRRLLAITTLQQRIEKSQADPAKQSLVPILQEQLAELRRKPLDEVSFDSAYGYPPTTGLVGYSRKVRLLQNTDDGQSIIQVDNIALRIGGMETGKYASGKFLSVDKAILVGPLAAEQSVLGVQRVVYTARLVDLNGVLGGGNAAGK